MNDMKQNELKEGKTLGEVYGAILLPKDPRTEFIEALAELTGKTESAVKKWIYGETEPSSDMECEAIEKMTGYKKESLFPKRYSKQL